MAEKRFAFVDPKTGKTVYITKRNLDQKLAELVKLIETEVAKLKRIDGYALNGFNATVGLSLTGPSLALTLAYTLSN